MKIEKDLISKRIRGKYNYFATKKKLEELLEDIEWIELQIKSCTPPSPVRSYDLREEQFMQKTTSKESEYIDRKIDLELQLNSMKKRLENAVNQLLPIEQVVFRSTFERELNITQIAIAENSYLEYIKNVKGSLVIRLGILLNIAVLKEEGNQK